MIDVKTLISVVEVLVSISSAILLALRNRSKELLSGDRVTWWLPLSVVVGAGITLLWLMIHGIDRVHGMILYFRVIVPGVFLVCVLWLLVAFLRKRKRECISVLLALLGFIGISGALQRNEPTLRPSLRWFLWSRQYKAEVLAQPDPPNQEFKHVVWDTWGFPQTGFYVTYVVFDPKDSLANAVNFEAPGRFVGIPCEVPSVIRLEKQWYAVRFNADEDWVNCNSRTAGARQNLRVTVVTLRGGQLTHLTGSGRMVGNPEVDQKRLRGN